MHRSLTPVCDVKTLPGKLPHGGGLGGNLDPIFAFKHGTAQLGALVLKRCTSSNALGEATMAGRYQGCHVLRDVDGGCKEVEVFWGHCGWFWRPREPHDDTIGPFTTSTEAYESANAAVIRGANFGRTG
jgi:hypothetical protein